MIQELIVWLSMKLEWITHRSLVDELAWKYPRFQGWLVEGAASSFEKYGKRRFGIPEMHGLPWSEQDDAELKEWMK